MEQKLDKIDRQILAELDKNCRVSDNVLAKKVRKSRQAVAYRIKRLVDSGAITGFFASINPNKMGFRVNKIYLKLRNIPERKKELVKYLQNAVNVYWMGECDGSWDLIFAIYTENEYGFYELKNKIISSFKDMIVDFYGDYLLDVKQYPKMYFTNELSDPVEFGGVVEKNQLDDLDRKILAQVVGDARASTVEIARVASSTPTTVAARLKRMKELGVIIQYRIGVNLVVLGLEYYKAIFKLDSYEDEKKLLEFCSQIPQIQYFIRNLWQIETEFVVKNYDEYYGIINYIKEKFPTAINRVESVILRSDEWTPGYRKLVK